VYSGMKEIQVMWDVAIVISELFSCVVCYVNMRLDCIKIMSGYFSNSLATISILLWQLWQSCGRIKGNAGNNRLQILIFIGVCQYLCVGCCNCTATCSGWKEVHFTYWFHYLQQNITSSLVCFMLDISIKCRMVDHRIPWNFYLFIDVHCDTFF